MEETAGLPEKAAPVPSAIPGLPILAESLRSVGYSGLALRAVLGTTGDLPIGAADLAVYRRRLAAAEAPLGDVIALLTLGWSRPTDRCAAALGPRAVDLLVSSGCVREADGRLHPIARIAAHGEMYLASDRRDEDSWQEPLRVTGINPPATLLAALTVRRHAALTLDLGTGNGIQALLAARHSDRVVATDVNPRALAVAGFNAALNGVDNIELRLGSLFDPVADERFDLIVSNPPYVISPDSTYVFRDSGREPGALCAALVAELPSHLAAQGFATLLASWPVASDDWSSVPRGWLRDDSRAWLLHMRTEDALLHARQWNQPLAERGDLAGFDDAVDRWVVYLAERGIDEIAYGGLVLQQHVGPPTVVRADSVQAGTGSASAHIERVFAAHDLLAGVDDEVLSEFRCHVPPEHQVQRRLHLVDGAWRPGETLVTLGEGVGIEATLDPLMTEILLLATGGAAVAEAAVEVGKAAGIDPAQEGDLVAAACAMVRELIGFGMVVLGEASG